MVRNDFAIFIITYKRPDNIKTFRILRNYTGKLFLIVGEDDVCKNEYLEKYGDKVILFNKNDLSFDRCDNKRSLVGSVYPRNAIPKIAKELGLKYYLVLDDDYSQFRFRHTHNLRFVSKEVNDFDRVVNTMLEYFESLPKNYKSIAFAQGGDFIGGAGSTFFSKLRPHKKCMNSFFCAVDREFEFIGSMNEDVNTYCINGMRGNLMLTIPNVMIIQEQTQQSEGGLTEFYKDRGTYFKSFMTVMLCPSFVKVKDMGWTNRRIHHVINYKFGMPMIIKEKYKKL